MLQSAEPGILNFSAMILVIIGLWWLCQREIFWLSLKNLIKNLRRTLILFGVMVSGLTGLMIFFGYAEFSMVGFREGVIRTDLGHLQVYKKGYNTAGNVNKLEYGIPNYREITAILQSDAWLQDKIAVEEPPKEQPNASKVLGIAAQVEFAGIISNGRSSSIFIGKGIEVGKVGLIHAGDKVIAGRALAKVQSTAVPKMDERRLQEFDKMLESFLIPGIDPDDKVKASQGSQEWRKIWGAKNVRPADDNPSLDDALVGSGMAKALSVDIKSAPPQNTRLTMLVATKTGTMNAVDISVRGIIQGYAKDYNDAIVKIPIEYAWILMNSQDVSYISILLKDTALTEAAYQRVQQLIAEKNLDLEVTTWSTHPNSKLFNDVNMFFGAILFFIGVVITGVVFFAITNVMTMSVMERTREIGTLRALGESKWGIMRLFLAEGILIGVMGGVVAVLCGIGIDQLITMGGGFPQSPPPGSEEGYRAYLFIANRPVIWGVAFLLAFWSALLSSILPARKAASMEITECLRYT